MAISLEILSVGANLKPAATRRTAWTCARRGEERVWGAIIEAWDEPAGPGGHFEVDGQPLLLRAAHLAMCSAVEAGLEADRDASEVLRVALHEAHQALLDLVSGDGAQYPGGGGSAAAVIVTAEEAVLAWVGDVRVFRVNVRGRVDQLTRDHSFTEEFPRTHLSILPEPLRFTMTRCLGGARGEADVSSFDLARSDLLVVANKGIWRIPGFQEALSLAVKQASIRESVGVLMRYGLKHASGHPLALVVVQHEFSR